MSARNTLVGKRTRRWQRHIDRLVNYGVEAGLITVCVHCNREFFGYPEHRVCIRCVGAAVGRVLTMTW